MSTAATSAGAAGPFRDYEPDEAASGLSRSTPRQADDTTTRPSGSGPTQKSVVRDSEPDVSQTHWKPRPELDIDLNPDYPGPGNSECGGRPVG